MLIRLVRSVKPNTFPRFCFADQQAAKSLKSFLTHAEIKQQLSPEDYQSLQKNLQ
jgi:hypothetical protein